MKAADVAALLASILERLDRIDRHLAVTPQLPPSDEPPPAAAPRIRRRRPEALAAMDPDHPDHRRPVWTGGHVAEVCGTNRMSVSRWVRRGDIPPPTKVPDRDIPLHVPAKVLGATVEKVVRLPVAAKRM